MEPLPLVPQSTILQDHDTQAVIVEIFQDLLEKQFYPENVANNIDKYKVDNESMKIGAKNVKKTQNKKILSLKDIEIVEHKLLVKHGEYIVKEFSHKTALQRESSFKRESLLNKIQKKEYNKYGLLSDIDLLPNALEKSMDFKLNLNKHNCRHCLSDLDTIPSKLQASKSSPFSSDHKKLEINLTKCQEIFVAIPNHVSFINYKINKTYKKRIFLKNQTTQMQKFAISQGPKSKYFKVSVDLNSSVKIAPGMSATIWVTYRTDTLLDIVDTVTINTYGDEDIFISLVSYRPGPYLNVYIFKDITYNLLDTELQDKYDVERSLALNSTIDCGPCFIGNQLKIDIVIKNDGGFGIFFIITEENWFESDITNMHSTLELEAGCFTISPAHFAIDNDELLMLNVTFYTKESGLNLERLILLCNNNTYEKIDIIADGIFFDEYCLKLDEFNLYSLDDIMTVINVLRKQIPSMSSVTTMIHLDDDSFGTSKAMPIENVNEEDEYSEACESNPDISFNDVLETCSVSSNHELKPEIIKEEFSEDAVIKYLTTLMKPDESVEEDIQEPHPVYLHERFILNMEECTPYEEISKIITVFNNSSISIENYWEISDTETIIPELITANVINKDLISITGSSYDVLPGYSTTDFTVTILPNFECEGLYRSTIKLYARRIPICCIKKPKHFILKEQGLNDIGSKLVDLLVAQIEVICYLIPVQITFLPDDFEVKNILEYNEVYSSKFVIKLKYKDLKGMQFEWSTEADPDVTSVVKINPTFVLIKPEEDSTFELKIHNIGYADIEQIFYLTSPDSYFKTSVTVKATVLRPSVQFSTKELLLKQLEVNNIYKDTIRIIYQGQHTTVEWDIEEVQHCIDEGGNHFDKILHSQVSQSVGIFHENNETCDIDYIIKTEKMGNWHSTLYIYSTHGGTRFLSDTCIIKYNVTQMLVCLHTPMSQCPILCPDELLFINTKVSYTLCMHNYSKVPMNFRFGEPYGTKANLIKINIYPNQDNIRPDSNSRIDIELTPLSYGILDDIYVPCFFENGLNHVTLAGPYKEHAPIVLTILCAVEDIYVNITMPDVMEVIPWPPKMMYDFDYEFLDNIEFSGEHLEHECESFQAIEETHRSAEVNRPQFYDGSEIILNVPPCTPEKENQNALPHSVKALPTSPTSNITNKTTTNTTSLNTKSNESAAAPPTDIDYLEDITKYLLSAGNMIDLEEYEPPDEKSICSCSTELSDVLNQDYSLRDKFEEDFVLQEHVIEFRNVPLRKAIKQTIKIENITPLVGFIQSEVLNFPPLEPITRKIDDLLVKLKYIQEDKWSKCVPPEGVLVKLDYDKSEIKAFESINIDVWVYATTWGLYADEILIEINTILPFCVSVLIEVVGLPIEFPICANRKSKDYIFRFGIIPYRTEIVKRKMFIKNTSSIPVDIVWHIFMKNKNDKHQPINILFDIYHPGINKQLEKANSRGNLMITHGNFRGKPEENIFKLNPQETLINPQETVIVDITFYSQYFTASFEMTEINAYLIGYIQLADKYKYQPHVFKRKTGSQMCPSHIKLQATLEFPKLHLDIVYGDLKFIFYATEIIAKKFIRFSKILIFKNSHFSRARIRMEGSSDLKVVYMKTVNQFVEDSSVCIEVGPAASLEVKLSCEMRADAISSAKLVTNFAYTVTKKIYIFQKGTKFQTLPLSIVILYPEIEVPEELLDFGVVLVNNTRKLILTLKTTSACIVPFEIKGSFLKSKSCFMVEPVNGIIPAACHTHPGSLDVAIYFSPNGYRVYEECLKIISNVPDCMKEVNVRGIGSHDEKFFQHNKC